MRPELLVKNILTGLDVEKNCVVHDAVSLGVTVGVNALPHDLVEKILGTKYLIHYVANTTVNAIVAVNVYAAIIGE